MFVKIAQNIIKYLGYFCKKINLEQSKSAQSRNSTTPPPQKKIMHHMHGNVPYLFGFWADPFVHLLLLEKSSMHRLIEVEHELAVVIELIRM